MRKRMLVIAGAASMLVLAGCSTTTSSSPDSPTATGTRDPSIYPSIVIDVCAADAFKKEHLTGAINLDASDQPMFSNVVKALGKGSQYQVYCDDAARAAAATTALKAAGLNVTNLGTLKKASENSGLDIVK